MISAKYFLHNQKNKGVKQITLRVANYNNEHNIMPQYNEDNCCCLLTLASFNFRSEFVIAVGQLISSLLKELG